MRCCGSFPTPSTSGPRCRRRRPGSRGAAGPGPSRGSPRAEPGSPGVSVAVGDPEALPFADRRFDLAVSLLALQHANDLPGALVQVRRALKPDGLFVGCLLGGRTLTELRQVLTQAESEIEGG